MGANKSQLFRNHLNTGGLGFYIVEKQCLCVRESHHKVRLQNWMIHKARGNSRNIVS